MHADETGAVEIARLAADSSWTWSAEEVGVFCTAAGWQGVAENRKYARLKTRLPVNRPFATVFYNDGFLPQLVEANEDVRSVLVSVTDVVEESDAFEPSDTIIATFVHLASRLEEELGTAERRSPGLLPEIGWNLEGAILFLSAVENRIVIRIVNPRYQEWVEIPDDADLVDDQEQFSSIAVDADDPDYWTKAVDAFAILIRSLHCDDLLRIGQGAGRSVEVGYGSVSSEHLVLRCAVTAVESEKEFSTRSLWMRNEGWISHKVLSGREWTKDVDWPAVKHEFRELAESALRALQFYLEISDPRDLRGQIWRDSAASGSGPSISIMGVEALD